MVECQFLARKGDWNELPGKQTEDKGMHENPILLVRLSHNSITLNTRSAPDPADVAGRHLLMREYSTLDILAVFVREPGRVRVIFRHVFLRVGGLVHCMGRYAFVGILLGDIKGRILRFHSVWLGR